MDKAVRVRFAPSPTGALHIGGVRTALYNYLFAKKHQGTFILRIEDTDQKRYVAGAEQYINDTLNWLGIQPEESPSKGGEYAPYRQSERSEIYRKYAQQLIDEGKAYYAFDTEEELEAMRQQLEAAKAKNTSYNAITRLKMRNSLTLPPAEVQALIAQGSPYVIRFKTPRKEEVRFQDLIRDWVKVHSSILDDKVLIKQDGLPTYHLANVVDDYLMKISHVIRGEEWLPSAPLHVLLYKYLGWEDDMPQFAHLPLLLSPDGGKLSKRKAEEYGFPIFPLDWQAQSGETLAGFREQGYLPEALVNFLAFLGWSPGNEQEIFSLTELCEAFSLERVSKAGAKFDIDKAQWFNQQYLKAKPAEALLPQLREHFNAANLAKDWEDETLKKILTLHQERVTFLGDIVSQAQYLFEAPQAYDEKTVKKKWTPSTADFLTQFAQALEKLEVWEEENIRTVQHDLVESLQVKMGKVMPGVRLAITGLGFGPDLIGIMQIIGKTDTLRRIEIALDKLSVES